MIHSATVIGPDGTYWSDVRSDVIRVSSSSSLLSAGLVSSSETGFGGGVQQQTDEIKSRARVVNFKLFLKSQVTVLKLLSYSRNKAKHIPPLPGHHVAMRLAQKLLRLAQHVRREPEHVQFRAQLGV